jgi:hypothetical protein
MCKNNHLFTVAFFYHFLLLIICICIDADTISPLQQTSLGSTCFENPLMRRDNVQMTNNNPFGLGSSNGVVLLTPPQSPVMKNNVCHEAKSPFKQHLYIKFTPKFEEKPLPLKPVDLLDKFGMELIINANEKESKLIQELDMQEVKNIGMRELTNFDLYIISFFWNNSKVTNYIIL